MLLCALATALVVPREPLDLSAMSKRAPLGIIATNITKGRFFQYFIDVKVGSEGKVHRPLVDTGAGPVWFPNDDDWGHRSTSLVNNVMEPHH